MSSGKIRKRLKRLNEQRLSFSATVVRYGEKPAFKGPPIRTILLKNVYCVNTKEIVTDHLWFTAGKSWDNLCAGDQVSFDARVGTYTKGYKGYREDVYLPLQKDYRLERPTKVKVLTQHEGPESNSNHPAPTQNSDEMTL